MGTSTGEAEPSNEAPLDNVEPSNETSNLEGDMRRLVVNSAPSKVQADKDGDEPKIEPVVAVDEVEMKGHFPDPSLIPTPLLLPKPYLKPSKKNRLVNIKEH